MQIKSTALAGLTMICGLLHAAPNQPEWRIVETKYPTKDVVVAGYNVVDFGATGDGLTNDTWAIQRALDSTKAPIAKDGVFIIHEIAMAAGLTFQESVTASSEAIVCGLTLKLLMADASG